MGDRYGRAGQIDRAVEEAQTGRPESRKSKWERAGMTRTEYERGIAQIAQEKIDADVRQARIDRARKGQSNPGN